MALVVACVAPLAAVLVQFLIKPSIGNDAPFMPFFFAVIAAAWYGGFYPGLVATVIAGVLSCTLFLDPMGTLFFAHHHKLFWFVVFLVVGGGVSWLCESLHAARRQSEENQAKQRQAEQAATASEARFRHALEQSPLPTALCTQDGEILSLNRAWSELTGYTVAQFPNIRDWIAHACGTQEKAEAEFQRVFSFDGQRKEHGEIVVITAAGQRLIWDFSSAVLGQLPDGRRFAIITAKDITERKRSEETAELFRAVLERVNDAIELVDPMTGRILHMNQKACADLEIGRAHV